jgi:hypothetical protein
LAIAVPSVDVKKEVLFDGVEFDPAEPERYAKSFAVHSIA